MILSQLSPFSGEYLVELNRSVERPESFATIARAGSYNARAVAEHNVTVNNLLPGTFDTDRLKSNLAALARLDEGGDCCTIR